MRGTTQERITALRRTLLASIQPSMRVPDLHNTAILRALDAVDDIFEVDDAGVVDGDGGEDELDSSVLALGLMALDYAYNNGWDEDAALTVTEGLEGTWYVDWAEGGGTVLECHPRDYSDPCATAKAVASAFNRAMHMARACGRGFDPESPGGVFTCSKTLTPGSSDD